MHGSSLPYYHSFIHIVPFFKWLHFLTMAKIVFTPISYLFKMSTATGEYNLNLNKCVFKQIHDWNYVWSTELLMCRRGFWQMWFLASARCDNCRVSLCIVTTEAITTKENSWSVLLYHMCVPAEQGDWKREIIFLGSNYLLGCSSQEQIRHIHLHTGDSYVLSLIRNPSKCPIINWIVLV